MFWFHVYLQTIFLDYIFINTGVRINPSRKIRKKINQFENVTHWRQINQIKKEQEI